MKLNQLKTLLGVICAVAIVVGCGGSSENAGAPTSLGVVPDSIAVSGPKGFCAEATGFVAEVFIYGGAAPYRLSNTFPGNVVLSQNIVSEPGGSFKLAFTGGCLDPVQIVVVDKLNNKVTVTVKNVKGST
jgi:hypothetical protein